MAETEMTEYSVLEYLRGLLRQCPFLAQEANGFFVDYSERESPVNYGLYPTGEQVLQAYMDGGEQIQYDFVLQTVNATPEDVNRAENQKFIERFCRWMRGQSRALPDMGDGYDPIGLNAENGQFVDYSEDTNSGTYQIMCNFIYEKE